MPDIVLDYRRKIIPPTFSLEAQDTTEYSTTSTSFVLAKTINITGGKLRYITTECKTADYLDTFYLKLTYYDGTTEYTIVNTSFKPGTSYTTYTWTYFFSKSGVIRVYICISPYYSGDSAYIRTVCVYESTDYTSFTRTSSSNIVSLIGYANYYYYILIDSTDNFGLSTQVTTSITTLSMSKEIIITIAKVYELIVLSTI
jgi:hypothetical protein